MNARRLRILTGAGALACAAGAVIAPVAGAAPSAPSSLASTTSTTASSSFEASLPGLLAYTTDSDYYGSGGTETLATVHPDGSGRRVLLTSTTATLGLLSFSPSGQYLAYFHANSSIGRIDVMNLSTMAVHSVFTLRGNNAYIVGIAWTSGGSALIVGINEQPGKSVVHNETALWRVPVAGGKPTRLTPFEDAGDPSVAPDGDIVFVTSGTYSSTSAYEKSTLWIASPNGTDPRKLLSSGRFIAQPAVSPDGQTVVFSLISDDTTSHLEAVGTGGGGVTNLTPSVSGRSDILPSWSPDGSHLVFLSSRAGRYDDVKSDQLLDAYVMTASGGDVTKLIGFEGSEKSVYLITWGS